MNITAEKMNIIPIITYFTQLNSMHCENPLFLIVHLCMKSSPKYWIFGHRLTEVNTLEMKNFGTHLHLVFIPLSNVKFWLWRAKYICGRQMDKLKAGKDK